MSHLCFGVVAYIVDVINISGQESPHNRGNILGAFNALVLLLCSLVFAALVCIRTVLHVCGDPYPEIST